MSTKISRKIKAIKKIKNLADPEARSLAKNTTTIRVKRKRAIVFDPKKNLLMFFHRQEDAEESITMHIDFPKDSVISLGAAGLGVTVKLPRTLPKKKKEKPVDIVGAGK